MKAKKKMDKKLNNRIAGHSHMVDDAAVGKRGGKVKPYNPLQHKRPGSRNPHKS